MKECFVVVHRNYSEGTDAYAFFNEEDAKKCVHEDVNTEVISLKEEGYEPVVLDRFGSKEIYVPDSDIYYEWEILNTTIR